MAPTICGTKLLRHKTHHNRTLYTLLPHPIQQRAIDFEHLECREFRHIPFDLHRKLHHPVANRIAACHNHRFVHQIAGPTNGRLQQATHHNESEHIANVHQDLKAEEQRSLLPGDLEFW